MYKELFVSTSKPEEDELIFAPSWCAGMQDQIDFEVILEEEGINRSEGLRQALDEYFNLPHIKNIFKTITP